MMNATMNFATIETNSNSVRRHNAVLHNIVLERLSASGNLASVFMSSDVQTAAISAAVAAKVISAAVAADFAASLESGMELTVNAVMGFVSATVKGTKKDGNERRFYKVKGMGAVNKSVRVCMLKGADIDGAKVEIPAAKEKKERAKPAPLSDAEKIMKYEYEIIKIKARMEHTAAHKSEEFKFPTFKEWLAASAEVKAE